MDSLKKEQVDDYKVCKRCGYFKKNNCIRNRMTVFPTMSCGHWIPRTTGHTTGHKANEK